MLNILLVGCGKMGGAMAKRWAGLPLCKQMVIIDPVASISGANVQCIHDLKDLPATFRPNVIVFGVKPQTLGDIVNDYKNLIGPTTLVISIAAGKTIAFFETHLGPKTRIVRCMPNSPAAIGKGITAASASKSVSNVEREWTTSLLSAVGDVVWLEDEKEMNAVTALSGNGPAYLFLLIENLTEAGIKLGLEPVLAEKLARKTITGSAMLADMSLATPATKLRENVTSPGGTTEAAMEILLQRPGMPELYAHALKRASDRAEELSK
jgi:pyrroline-5-carboxylate reductase